MTKNEGRLEFLDESIRFVSENGGVIKTTAFVEKEQQMHPGMDTTSCYHKIVMARYFGLVLLNQYSSYYFLTEAGTIYSRARTQNQKIDAILKALTSVTFGRNNNAVSSDSDIEAPVVLLKSVAQMRVASITQIGLILYYMDNQNYSLGEAIDAVLKCDNPTKIRQDLVANRNSKYFDVKFNKLFEELGILVKTQDGYKLSEYVKEKHIDFINNLPELKPIDSKAIDRSIDSAKQPNIDIFNHHVYGIHIKKKNDALSDEHPHICIGWSKLGDLSNLNSREALNNRHSQIFTDATSYSRGQDVGQIHRFVNEAAVGDYVVFAEPGVCHIGRITSDYFYDSKIYPDQSDDYVNVRNVEWLKKDIKRSDLSKAFHNSLGAAMSFWGLNDYKSVIHELLKGTYVKDLSEVSEDDIIIINENETTNYTVDDLSKKLYEMYNSADNKTTAVHMFGLKYAEEIRKSGVYVVDIVKKAGIAESYHAEASKGIRIYDSICNNDYGIRFINENDPATTCESVKVTLPEVPKRTRKTFVLNSILYGAPGTGKTYATAKYALAIIEGKALSEYSSVPREEIMKKYNQLIKDKQVVFTTFHQNYGYEDFIQGIRPDTSTKEMHFKTVDGVFKKIAEAAMASPEKDFVIIIDEINRANISKVFGELITLIEEDKRWGEENAVSVTLPSGETFAVPNNLYIVGTMNSADKSISLIDTALRRRFEFVEFVPDLTTIDDDTLKEVLKKINNGISKELNSTDLLVGHSYFINKNVDDICNIMNRSIIPLLYEYFFDNKNKVEVQLKSALEDLDVEIVSNTMGRIKIKKKEG